MSDVQENHSTAFYIKTQPPDFSSSFLTRIQNKIIFYFLPVLIAWPLACKVEKGENMHIEEELLHKALLLCIFMQITHEIIQESLCRSSSHCPLVSVSTLLYAWGVAADGVCDWFYTNV